MTDSFGTIATWHKRYKIGDDDHGIDETKYRSFEEMAEAEFRENDVWRPIYMYDHSCLTFSTISFPCPWDSWQLGFIFARENEIKKRFGKINKTTLLKAEALLIERVEALNESNEY